MIAAISFFAAATVHNCVLVTVGEPRPELKAIEGKDLKQFALANRLVLAEYPDCTYLIDQAAINDGRDTKKELLLSELSSLPPNEVNEGGIQIKNLSAFGRESIRSILLSAFPSYRAAIESPLARFGFSIERVVYYRLFDVDLSNEMGWTPSCYPIRITKEEKSARGTAQAPALSYFLRKSKPLKIVATKLTGETENLDRWKSGYVVRELRARVSGSADNLMKQMARGPFEIVLNYADIGVTGSNLSQNLKNSISYYSLFGQYSRDLAQNEKDEKLKNFLFTGSNYRLLISLNVQVGTEEPQSRSISLSMN